jgi:hypothetical protein
VPWRRLIATSSACDRSGKRWLLPLLGESHCCSHTSPASGDHGRSALERAHLRPRLILITYLIKAFGVRAAFVGFRGPVAGQGASRYALDSLPAIPFVELRRANREFRVPCAMIKVLCAVIKAVCASIKARCVAINWQRCRVPRVAKNARGSIIVRTPEQCNPPFRIARRPTLRRFGAASVGYAMPRSQQPSLTSGCRLYAKVF